MAELINVINGSDISRDDFSKFVDSCVVTDSKALQDYCNKKQTYANQLVFEKEFVGRTYVNLEILKKVLRRQSIRKSK